MHTQCSRTMLAALALLGLATCWQGPVFAQEARGTVVGSVLDPSGAAIPGATVVVTNLAIGTKLTLTTNEAGMY